MLHRGLRLGVQLCRQQDEGEGLAAAARRPGNVARGRAAADPRDVGQEPRPWPAASCAGGSFMLGLRPHALPRVPVSPQGPEPGGVDGKRVSCLVAETVHKRVFTVLTPQDPGVALSSGCSWLCHLAIWPWGARHSPRGLAAHLGSSPVSAFLCMVYSRFVGRQARSEPAAATVSSCGSPGCPAAGTVPVACTPWPGQDR